jgi:hypothetical protein
MLLRVVSALVAGFAVVIVVAVAGTAKDAQIGSASVSLPVPAGFCEMTEDQPSDARMIKAIGGMLASAQVEPLVLSADCKQLDAWRLGLRPVLDDFAQYQTPIAGKNSDFPRAESIKGFCITIRAKGQDISGMTDDLNARMENVLKNAKFNEMSFLGVLEEDSDACYFGLLQKVRTEVGTEKTQVSVTALTIVKGKAINFVLYTVYHDKDTVAEALARQKRNVAALLAANNESKGAPASSDKAR